VGSGAAITSLREIAESLPELETMMNTELQFNAPSLGGLNDSDVRLPQSAFGLLFRLIGQGVRTIWAGYVRNLERSGFLPPMI
jgi:hypothetical protein